MAGKVNTALNDADELFAITYLNNGLNATAAYKSVHPNARKRTAEVVGSRLLRKAEIGVFIKAELKARKKRLQMDGDETLEAITRIARGDPRRLFRDNKLLPISEWPDDIADCVKALKPTPFGTAVVLYDKLRARELMAIATGKLRHQVDHKHGFDHLAFLGDEPPAGDEDE